MTRLVFISDTHELHEQVKLPEGDILIHTGDITNRGYIQAIYKFSRWMEKQKFKHKIAIAGNHDSCFENGARVEAIQSLINAGVIYLQNSGITIEGLKFYGSPIPFFYNWSFNVQRGPAIKRYWDKIPDDTEILLTHGPALNRLDETISGEHVGCQDLLNRIGDLKKLKLHAHGHIHHSWGQTEVNGIKFVNASICDEGYRSTNLPIIIDI